MCWSSFEYISSRSLTLRSLDRTHFHRLRERNLDWKSNILYQYIRQKNSKFLNIKYWSIFKKISSLTDEKWRYLIWIFKPKQIFSCCLRFYSDLLRKTYRLIRWFSNLNSKISWLKRFSSDCIRLFSCSLREISWW